jgi:hypothetical protein
MTDETIHALKQMSETLKAFWQRFGGRKNRGATHEQADKLEALQKLGMVKFSFKRAESKSSLRSKFEFYKEAKRNPRHSLKSHPKCFICQGPARERHHIIALKNGGKNWKKNLVSLCKGCHDKVEGRK